MPDLQKKPFRLSDVVYQDADGKSCVLYRASDATPKHGDDGRPIFIAMPELGKPVSIFDEQPKTGRTILLLHTDNLEYLLRAAGTEIVLIPWEPYQGK